MIECNFSRVKADTVRIRSRFGGSVWDDFYCPMGRGCGDGRTKQSLSEASRGRKRQEGFCEEEKNVRDRGNGMSSIMHQWRVGWFESLLRHTRITAAAFLSFFLSIFPSSSYSISPLARMGGGYVDRVCRYEGMMVKSCCCLIRWGRKESM